MFRVSHEFTFSIQQNGELVKFVGQLIFKGKELNGWGTLHSEQDMENFGIVLNQTLALPEYWTLELVVKSLFEKITPIFKSLYAINLCMESAPYRVVEFSNEDYPFIDAQEADCGILEESGSIN